MQKFMKILPKFDKILPDVGQSAPAPRRPACPSPPVSPIGAEFCQNFVKISSNFSKISINFCIQYSIFQHFSKSTHFCKILQNFCGFLKQASTTAVSRGGAKACRWTAALSVVETACRHTERIVTGFCRAFF